MAGQLKPKKQFTPQQKESVKRGYCRSLKDLIPTYDEPLLEFDLDFNLKARYKNIEDAYIETGIKPFDLHWNSCVPYFKNPHKGRIILLENSRNLQNQYMNVDCTIYDIYKESCPKELLSKL